MQNCHVFERDGRVNSKDTLVGSTTEYLTRAAVQTRRIKTASERVVEAVGLRRC
jgi:hypothetical protein